MKSSKAETMKLQDHLRYQPAVSFFESRPRQESLHSEAMRRKLDFAAMVSQGRTVLAKHFQKRA
jgi:hypothetical protein